MNFAKLQEKENVKSFIAYKDHLAYLDRNDLLVLNGQSLGHSGEGFFFKANKFYYPSDSGTRCLDLVNGESTFIEETLPYVSQEEHTFVKGFNYVREANFYFSAQLAVFQFEPFQKLYELPGRYTYGTSIKQGNHIYGLHITVLKAISLKTGEIEWVTDLASFGGITQVLGMWHNWLVFWLNSNQLLCLDAETGQTAWLSPNLNDAYQRNGFYSGTHLLAEEDKVVILYNNSYFEFNLAKQEVSLVKDFGPRGTGWVFATSTVSGQYIYFTGRDYSTGQIGTGAFDRHRLAVVWFYAPVEWQGQVPKDYEGNAVVLNVAPQVTDTHLYVLENGTSSLHIFKT